MPQGGSTWASQQSEPWSEPVARYDPCIFLLFYLGAYPDLSVCLALHVGPFGIRLTCFPPEPWPDTQTLVSIDTWTLPTPQTLVSIDTSQTRSDTAPTRSDTPNWRFRQLRRVGRVYRVSIVSNSDTLTLLTRPTRLATHVSPHKSPRMPTAKLGMQPMGLLGGSNPWPWPFGTTTPSTSAVGRHPDTSDTSDTQTLDTQTRSDTPHASQLSRALRHRLDTGQTPLTLLTPVSFDTAQTLIRHA